MTDRPGKQWWEVLGVSPEADIKQIHTAYRAKAREASERQDEAALQELNVARDKAMGNTSA